MSERLAAPAWLTAPETAAVFDALEAIGGPDCARVVGGCVRNALIDQPIDDIDIATRLMPDQVVAALEAAKLRVIPTGIEHGTVTAISGGRPYEITTLRRDVETDGRRAVVAFTDDWGQDAQRRDFTLNALYAGRDGAVFDPTGQGVADARAGRIVFVGDPAHRIAEDYLRILRFFRFFAWYGRGRPDGAALAACAAFKDQVAALSAERVSKELLKLLDAADPRGAIRLMADAGVLTIVLGTPGDLGRFNNLVEISPDPDAMLRLAALAPDDPATAAQTAKRLRLSNAKRDRLIAALTPTPAITRAMDDRMVRAVLYRIGSAAFHDRARLAWAGDPQSARWPALIQGAKVWTPPVFPLTGDDVVAAGVPKGPKVGAALRAVEDWWIDRDFPDDPAALAEKLAAVVRAAA